MAYNSENVSPLSSESTLTESKLVSREECASATPTPSYASQRSSMDSFASSDLQSMHSEVASEYSTVLSAIASIGLHSSVSTRYPSNQDLDEVDGEPFNSLLSNRVYLPSVVNSEDADLIDYALIGDARNSSPLNEHANQNLSPISLNTEHTIVISPNGAGPAVRGVQRVSIDLASRGHVAEHSGLQLRRRDALPGFLDQLSQESDSSGFATSSPSLIRSGGTFEESPADNLSSDEWAASIGSDQSQQVPSLNGTDNALSPCIPFDDSYDDQQPQSDLRDELVSCESASKSWVHESENCHNVALDELNRKRGKKAFDPAPRVLDNSGSSNDASLHSFKVRRLRDVVSHPRNPNIEADTPSHASVDTSSTIADLDLSSIPGNNSSLFLSSGDSSRDEALLSLSIARAFKRQRLPSHCPTPMTNVSSPSPPKHRTQSPGDDSRLELSNTSEENSIRDDEIIKELTARAFATTRSAKPRSLNLRGCLVSDSTSSCSSPKVRKKVRFNNEPAIMSFQWSPECDTIPEERTFETDWPNETQQCCISPDIIIHEDAIPETMAQMDFDDFLEPTDDDLRQTALHAAPSAEESVREPRRHVSKFPVTRETRSSILRAQLCQRRKLSQANLRGGKLGSGRDRKRNRDAALNSQRGSSASSVVGRPAASKLVRRQ